jgi:hypothetical protein
MILILGPTNGAIRPSSVCPLLGVGCIGWGFFRIIRQGALRNPEFKVEGAEHLSHRSEFVVILAELLWFHASSIAFIPEARPSHLRVIHGGIAATPPASAKDLKNTTAPHGGGAAV